MSRTPRQRILITMGDPLGIGPEVIVKALRDPAVTGAAEFYIIGQQRAFQTLRGFATLLKQKNIHWVEITAPRYKDAARTAGAAAAASLDEAVKRLWRHEADALVTAPISKAHVQKAGFAFPGHTEFLCQAFGVKRHAMMLFHSRLRVVLLTIHTPLKDIFPLLTRQNLQEKLELTAQALRTHFGIARPRIAVCGLNPHAGEEGLIGAEEKRVFVPALRALARHKALAGVELVGPRPADTVFHEALCGRYDAVICHYHDQGLIPLKTTGFDEGVNMTLGLPFVRTSPDHGTAFDIAGKNRADPQSMRLAIRAALGNFD